MMTAPLFKIASQPEEFEQIHRLNYRTFVEEIPQHPANAEGKLVDRFHRENIYFICVDADRLAGMVAVRPQRPFSLDAKVPELDRFLPEGSTPCEFRLLAVEPPYRRTPLFSHLIHFAASECIRRGFDLGVASGTTRQSRLYRRMGFVPFANLVGTQDASYQPMYITLPTAVGLLERLKLAVPEPPQPVSFLPGPVEVSAAVAEAFAAPAVSHRSAGFLRTVAETKEMLCKLTRARHVEILLGSGTLANDVVAAHLRVQEGEGIILSNGEFGNRLVDHAQRMGLAFRRLCFPWGEPYDLAAVERAVAEPGVSWLWSTHCETSSGILNDLEALTALCRSRGVRLCVDCTSSLGAVPVDFSGVFLAVSVSGKALASRAGAALVFCNADFLPDSRIPRYLDLGTYRSRSGVPFTHSSNVVAALHRALRELEVPARFDDIRRLHELLRRELEAAGLAAMVAGDAASPAVLSIRLPEEISSLAFGEALDRRGFLLSYRSEYLVAANIVQVCLMGRLSENRCRRLAAAMADLFHFSTGSPPRTARKSA